MAKKTKVKSKTTKVSGLLSIGDIGKMCGVPGNTVQHWRQRDPSFPKPIDHPTAGRLYKKNAVINWLKKTGRMK